jgi:hypothetical protein
MRVRVNTVKASDEISYWLWCPGCEDAHRITNLWDFDGNLDQPTFSPSILSQGVTRCHSFVRAGFWEFLDDCDHDLAGKTVPMVHLPKWLAEE